MAKKKTAKAAVRKKTLKRAVGKPVKVNGYTISYNPIFAEYSVTHPEIGYCTGFKLKRKAIEYAHKG